MREHIDAARAVYLDRLALGYPTADARREALAYLRRKTGWAEPFAAGVLDRALEYPVPQAYPDSKRIDRMESDIGYDHSAPVESPTGMRLTRVERICAWLLIPAFAGVLFCIAMIARCV